MWTSTCLKRNDPNITLSFQQPPSHCNSGRKSKKEEANLAAGRNIFYPALLAFWFSPHPRSPWGQEGRSGQDMATCLEHVKAGICHQPANTQPTARPTRQVAGRKVNGILSGLLNQSCQNRKNLRDHSSQKFFTFWVASSIFHMKSYKET